MDTEITRRAGTPHADERRTALRGFVWWRVTGDGWLESFPATRWRPGPNEASCAQRPRLFTHGWTRRHPMGIPGPTCACGFRAALRPVPAGPLCRGDAADVSGHEHLVLGAIDGWGSCVSGEREWRSAHAQPVAVFVAPERFRLEADRLGLVASRYRIPIVRDLDAFVRVWGRGQSL